MVDLPIYPVSVLVWTNVHLSVDCFQLWIDYDGARVSWCIRGWIWSSDTALFVYVHSIACHTHIPNDFPIAFWYTKQELGFRVRLIWSKYTYILNIYLL